MRRAAVGVLAGTLTLTGATIAAGVSPANAVEGFEFDRLAGDNRYETAATIALETFTTTVDDVILASGEQRNFPDALTGNYLAGAVEAPVLLTQTAALTDVTAAALAQLDPTTVHIVGGTDAVSAAVEAELRAAGYTVNRIGGADRYATAQLVADEVADAGVAVGEVAGESVAILGNGQNFADILAAGPISYARQVPLTITRPNSLPSNTAQVLRDLGIERVIVVGGTDAVNESVVNEVEAIVGDGNVDRVAGALNRYETAAEIAELAVSEFGFSNDHVDLARGDDFADALAGGPHSGVNEAPILLTTPATLSPAAEEYLRANACTITEGHIFGGFAAVSAAAEAEANEAAQDCPNPVTVTPTGGDTTIEQGGNFVGTITVPAGSTIDNVAVIGDCIDDNVDVTETGTAGGDFDFSLPVNSDATTGACSIEFTVTVDGEDFVQTVDITVEAPATNQDFTVTPTEAAVNLVSAAGTNTGARQYAVSGLTAGTTYDVVLFDADNVTNTNGVVSFADEENTNGGTVVEGNNQADAGSTPAVIEQVNGQGIVPSSVIEAVAAADGTLTFLVDSTVPTSVVPVVFLDAFDGTDTDTTADDNNLLDLAADNTPLEAELFAIGGQKTYTPAEAADNQPTVDEQIVAVDEAANTFVTGTGAAAKFYVYEAEDAFFVGGTRVSQAEFERQLSVGDVLDDTSVYFNEGDAETANDGPSTFVLNDVTPAEPGTVTANRVSDTSVLVTITDNTEPGDVDNFNVYRAAITTTVTSCPTALSGYTLVGTIAPDAGTAEADSFTDTGLAANTTYCYTVTAVLDGDESDFNQADVAQTTTLAAGGTALPESIDAFVSNDTDADAGPFEQLGTVNAGDEFTIVFDEALADANGVFRASDAGGATTDFDCNTDSAVAGQTEATCALNTTTTTIDGAEYAAGRVLTVTVGTVGTVTGDGVLNYPLTVTQAAGFADADNDGQWTPAGDPDNVIDDEGDKTVVVNSAPGFTSSTVDDGQSESSGNIVLTFNEVLAAASNATLVCDTAGNGTFVAEPGTATESTNTLVFNPTSALVVGDNCELTYSAVDADGDESTDTLAFAVIAD